MPPSALLARGRPQLFIPAHHGASGVGKRWHGIFYAACSVGSMVHVIMLLHTCPVHTSDACTGVMQLFACASVESIKSIRGAM